MPALITPAACSAQPEQLAASAEKMASLDIHYEHPHRPPLCYLQQCQPLSSSRCDGDSEGVLRAASLMDAFTARQIASMHTYNTVTLSLLAVMANQKGYSGQPVS